MTVSVFDLFRIGVGPSSSHTVGPMLAGLDFARKAHTHFTHSGAGTQEAESGAPHRAACIVLYGSLAATGAGHGTFGACLLGLDGCDPATVDPDYMDKRLAEIRETRTLHLAGDESMPITCGFEDIILRPGVRRSIHTNAVTFVAAEADTLTGPGAGVAEPDAAAFTGSAIDDGAAEAGVPAGDVKETYYSIGGGFIRTADDIPSLDELSGDFLFDSGDKLIALAEHNDCGISDIQRFCERSLRTDVEIDVNLDAISSAMQDCAKRGFSFDGTLPGALHVRRRAKRWYEQLLEEDPELKPEHSVDWVNLVALAVNEENAAGGRVVTAPTNGAAGIIPAVMHYAREYTPLGQQDRQRCDRTFLLAAGAVGSLYKERASISGAEVGCQGEVGSAASMAAAGLAEVLGGSPRQVANAAEITMEHSLGLTCDPIAGLVQIPCIERNAISAAKAINCAKMALRGDGEHHVTLDEVIETMRQTGADMSDRYKETASGGLAINVAVNVPEC
ncbi:L-serine ammonia-lyase [Corynebacterium heidelbergense]|uniref:L-serine ammonia-lyase n=1 Tax=Corynebacterium heidelbergense TaxID=2055947 RepID=A0A364VAK6_9CORY|nr:L-serine ammonia-lyase [Corynebacterium heidelbergense]RAV33682.1 L-serine ammonia-lyase [Corynebacterium heidelbergense]WCZ37107.1 L-serine dehydratase TdcG [Corynebacterium heidelbergense]